VQLRVELFRAQWSCCRAVLCSGCHLLVLLCRANSTVALEGFGLLMVVRAAVSCNVCVLQ
jgi:hypothetical protein